MAQQIELPSQFNTHSNKPASLYHTCLTVLDKLACVPGFDNFMNQDVTTPTSLTIPSPSPTTDPVSKLWNICRKGSSLCFLFNTLRPTTPVKVNEDASLTSANACKANVYHFIVGCQKELHFSDEDLFTICDLTQDDTNGFVKVVHTVSTILNMMEKENIIKVQSSKRMSDPPPTPTSARAKRVNELVETERKFVQDLEALQDYMREIQTQKILPPDTIHYLFSNLNALVDFQRKFLIKLEEIAEKKPEEQRFGHLFIQMESLFSVYDVFCANYPLAQDLVIQETPKLQKLVDVANPTYELQSLLIKPVQRLCRYPLLMEKLVEDTDASWPYYTEMREGLEATSRAASRVNEVSRRIENQKSLEDLKRRVDDWRGLSVDQFGSLLLEGKFIMSSNDAEKELLVYLFDKILIICKEMKEGTKSRLPKTNAISINKKKRRASLLLKGKIFVSFIIKVVNTSSDGVYSLKIFWQNNDVESFSLKCPNEEHLQRWETTLNTVLGETRKPPTADNGFDIKQYSTHWQLSGNGQPINTGPGSHDDDHDAVIDENDDEEDYEGEAEEIMDSQYRTRNGSNVNDGEYGRYYTSKHRATGGMAGVAGAVPMRHYPTAPGMTLPPLPRSTFSLPSTSTPTSQTDYNRYPASPPPSTPSSPTSSARGSAGSSSAISVWQRRNNESPLTDTIAKFMMGDDLPTPTEEHRSYTTVPIGRTQSQTPNGVKKNSQYGSPHSIQMRSRSKSSPDVHKNRNSWGQTMDRDQYGLPTTRVPPFNSDVIANQVKIKLNYPDGIYVIRVEPDIKYMDLLERVSRKIGPLRPMSSPDALRLKYQDEEGDLITINSDEDVQMGIEAKGNANTVNLFVSC